MIKKITLLAFCIACAAHAQRPLRWEASAVQTAQVTFDCTRGETLTFAPYIKAYGTTLTNYTASFQWQTNGMGSAFWNTNALVFTPSMDFGANRYRFFIRAESTNGVIYSANGTINMLHGPGAIINALPLPVQQIDFAAISWLNAPWLLAELDPGIPAAMASAVAQASTNAQASAAAAQANAIAFAATNKATRLFNPDDISEYIDGAGNKYVISNFWSMALSPGFAAEYGDAPAQTSYVFTAYSQYYEDVGSTEYISRYWRIEYSAQNSFMVTRAYSGIYMNWWTATTNAYVLDSNLANSSKFFIQFYSTTNFVGTLAMTSDIPAPTSGLPDVWTNMTWGASGTNATYRMYWDITNGTFAVEEIIP